MFFRGVRDSQSEKIEDIEVAHKVGSALFHVGQHWHGSTSLQSGERHNVVMWFRSSKMRQSAAESFFHQCENKLEHAEL